VGMWSTKCRVRTIAGPGIVLAADPLRLLWGAFPGSRAAVVIIGDDEHNDPPLSPPIYIPLESIFYAYYDYNISSSLVWCVYTKY
jgi:hypothetical protein